MISQPNGNSFGPNSRITTSSSHGSGGTLTTSIHDLLPSEGSIGGSSRPSTAGASSTTQNDLSSVDVELLEREATTIDDAGLSTDDIEARRAKQRVIAIDDAAMSMQDKWRLSNVLRGAMPFAELTSFNQSLHAARSVTILLLSTFSDFQAERQYLHTEIFPDLRDQLRNDCQIELNVLDIWLGIDDEKQVTPLDWHNFANFLIGQGRTGTPLICMFLSGHKYGQPVVTPVFDEDSMAFLSEFCSSDAITRQLLADAFWPDIGQTPHDIVDRASVQAVAPERRQFILRQEVLSSAQIHALSYLIASASVKRPELQHLVSSGPDLLFDILASSFNPLDMSLIIFSRRIAGLRDNTHLPVCRAYCDSDSESPADFCQLRLKQFHDKLCRLSPELATRLNLELKINDLNGVNCERHAKFSKHLSDGGKLLYHAVKDCQVVKYFRNHNPLACVTSTERQANMLQITINALDILVREATVHLMFAHEHAINCVGREQMLDEILRYVTSHETNSNTFCKPLAILGNAGCGQSTLLSSVVLKLIERAFPGDSSLIVIPRFANLTPESSELKTILRGMLLHLAWMIGGATRANRELDSPDDIASVKNRFIHELQTLRQSVRVVFLLDGLESLRSSSTAGCGDFIDWLPSVLSERVRVVVCLKRENEEAVTHFAARYGDGCILNIEDFTPEQANELLKTAFSANGQHLMFTQWQALRKAIDSISEANGGGVSAPYLALIREAALRWHSFTSVSPNYFGINVEDELDRIFSIYELRNGVTLTRHTLAYLTAAGQRGISLSELGDILSLDNFVLHALAQGETGTGTSSDELANGLEVPNYTFTAARVPTLALYRLLFEVNPFLAQRTVDSLAVIVWADGLLSKFAKNRYLLADAELARMVNSNMAEYFLGSWAGKTPKDLRLSVCDNNNNDSSSSNRGSAKTNNNHSIFSQNKAVRYVLRQPLAFTDCRTPEAYEANIRRLSCLPHYLLSAGRHRDLCTQVLFNLEWLMAKISSMGVDKVLTDYQEAINGVRNSNLISPTGVDEIGIVRDAIKFSRSILSIKPHFLPGLLLARLLAFQHSARLATLHKNICSLLNQCDRISAADRRNSLVPVASSLDTPGSPLIYIARINRNSPMTIATSPLHALAIQTNYSFIMGLKLESSLSARFWTACGCGSLGANWFCAPVRSLPQGPFYKLNTPGGRLFAVIAEKQILQVFHIESGERVYSVHLQQQIEVKQFVSSDRYIVIIPGLTTISSLNGAPDSLQNESNNNKVRPTSGLSSGPNSRCNSSLGNNLNPNSTTTVTQPTGPIIIDMHHRAVAHRFAVRPDLAAISSDNDVFVFTADEEIFVYQLPMMDCIHTFRTDMPPVFLHIVPPSVHGRSDDVRILVVTNHGSVVMTVINRKVSKSIFKPVLPYRESFINPVVQVDTLRGGVMGLMEAPGRLFLIGLRDGSLLEEFTPPKLILAPRRFTAATFACSDQMITAALDTGHIVLYRIGGDSASIRIINPGFKATGNPLTNQIVTHMYGPSCCWRILALSTNGNETYLRCWDVERLSSLSHVTDHSHIIAPGNILGIFAPSPYVDGVGDASPMAVAILSQPQHNNTQQCCLQVFDLKARSISNVPMATFDWSQRVDRVLLSPESNYCFVVDTNRQAILYGTPENPENSSYTVLETFSNVNDSFFTSPIQESGRSFETLFVLVTDDSLISVYRLGYGNAELVHSIQTRQISDPIFLPQSRTLCFLTLEPNQHRAKEDVKLAIVHDILRPELKTSHLFEIWRTEGNAHWELSHLLPIQNKSSQILVLFTVAELSAGIYPILKRDHLGCFAYDVQSSKMLWSSLGNAAFHPNSSITPEALFLPMSRLPFLHIDSRAKLACDVDLGTIYDLQLGVRVKPQVALPCCIESFRFLLQGEYFCALSSDRRKVLACRSSDEMKMAEFELFGLASCVEVVPCREAKASKRVIVIGMEDGRIVSLSFVADLCDPVFEHINQFRRSL